MPDSKKTRRLVSRQEGHFAAIQIGRYLFTNAHMDDRWCCVETWVEKNSSGLDFTDLAYDRHGNILARQVRRIR